MPLSKKKKTTFVFVWLNLRSHFLDHDSKIFKSWFKKCSMSSILFEEYCQSVRQNLKIKDWNYRRTCKHLRGLIFVGLLFDQCLNLLIQCKLWQFSWRGNFWERFTKFFPLLANCSLNIKISNRHKLKMTQ